MLKALAILAVILVTWATPPTDKDAKDASQHTQCSEGNKTGTENCPLVVKTHAVESDQEAADEAAKEAEQKHANLWNIRLAGIIALATIAQALIYLFQSRLMRRSLNVSEKTLVLAQRPRVIARTFYFSEYEGTLPSSVGVSAGSYAKGQFYIENVGGTNATVEEIWSDICITKMLPGKRPYEGKVGHQQPVVLAPGKHTYYTFGLKTPMTEEGVLQIRTTYKSFYVLGWLGYRDDLGIYRKTRFCRRYDMNRDRFVPVENDPDYESAD